MRDQYGFGSLQVGVGRHHRITRRLRLDRECPRPVGEMAGDGRALLPHVEAEVGRNLLVAAAAGVQLETKIADTRHQLQLDKVVNVFRLGAAVNVAGRTLRVFVANGVQRAHDLFQFLGGEDARGRDGARVGFAGSHFLGKQLPVKYQ